MVRFCARFCLPYVEIPHPPPKNHSVFPLFIFSNLFPFAYIFFFLFHFFPRRTQTKARRWSCTEWGPQSRTPISSMMCWRPESRRMIRSLWRAQGTRKKRSDEFCRLTTAPQATNFFGFFLWKQDSLHVCRANAKYQECNFKLSRGFNIIIHFVQSKNPKKNPKH